MFDQDNNFYLISFSDSHGPFAQILMDIIRISYMLATSRG